MQLTNYENSVIRNFFDPDRLAENYNSEDPNNNEAFYDYVTEELMEYKSYALVYLELASALGDPCFDDRMAELLADMLAEYTRENLAY